jgi:hypothetical protein
MPSSPRWATTLCRSGMAGSGYNPADVGDDLQGDDVAEVVRLVAHGVGAGAVRLLPDEDVGRAVPLL